MDLTATCLKNKRLDLHALGMVMKLHLAEDQNIKY